MKTADPNAFDSASRSPELPTADPSATGEGSLPTLPGSAAIPGKFDTLIPLFCEQCHYNMTGLPIAGQNVQQQLCHQCPECGHLQPVDTPRRPPPTRIQRLISGAMKVGLALLIGSMIFGWGTHCVTQTIEWSGSGIRIGWDAVYYDTRPLIAGDLIITASLGLLAGWVVQQFILKFRHGFIALLILGASVTGVMWIGAWSLLLKAHRASGTITYTSASGTYSKSIIVRTSAISSHLGIHLLLVFLASLLGAWAISPLMIVIWKYVLRSLPRNLSRASG